MELAITLNNRLDIPLHRQLYDELRQSILAGRLAAGARVPSTRALAQSLHVSRTTVTQSYEQLISEGYLQAAIGSGTTVCHQLPDDWLQTSPLKRAVQKVRARPKSVRLSEYGESLNDAE